jgi:hypothetical protein
MSALTIDLSGPFQGVVLPYRVAAPVRSASRISLVATPAPEMRDWHQESPTSSIIFLEAAEDPALQLAEWLSDENLDFERFVIDGGISTRGFLDVLAGMPSGRAVEVLWICEEGNGYLSTVGRGGDRILYALGEADIRFYLEVNGLVVERQILPRAR